jgi:predicted nucleic acid-binding Zn ribbon protein
MPAMKSPASPPSKVSAVLRNVLQRVDPDQQLRAYDIWTFWDDEVGEGIARRAQPARFRNGILFVTVATHSWMQELQYLKDSIRERLNARLGAALVRDIYFVSGSVERATAATTPAPATPSNTTPLAPIALPPIADPALAAAFARVVTAATRRR